MQTTITNNAKETQDLANKVANQFLKNSSGESAVVLSLKGNLGSGKTTFIQGFAKGLGVKEKILSPTFVIMKRFSIQDKNWKNFYHIDCYRINKPEEILELGFKDIIADPKNIVAIEWPEKISKFLPKKTIYIEFKNIGESARDIRLGDFEDIKKML